MRNPDLLRGTAAELLGTAFLLAAIVGSGIMGERLAGGNVALALLANTLSTGAMLTVLILVFAPLSGAHFNPAVTLAFLLRRELPAVAAAAWWGAQLTGALVGVAAAHLMFVEPVAQLSTQVRDGAGQYVSEAVATFGLVFTILACRRRPSAVTAAAVGLYIASAYWFTASTSFANPAVTIGRAFTDSFSGIAAANVPLFVVAQTAGAGIAVAVARWLFHDSTEQMTTGSTRNPAET